MWMGDPKITKCSSWLRPTTDGLEDDSSWLWLPWGASPSGAQKGNFLNIQASSSSRSTCQLGFHIPWMWYRCSVTCSSVWHTTFAQGWNESTISTLAPPVAVRPWCPPWPDGVCSWVPWPNSQSKEAVLGGSLNWPWKSAKQMNIIGYIVRIYYSIIGIHRMNLL